MDAFYASVEQRDNPALRGRPVIVGGKPKGRGVVAACSYEAREFGVHSAMPSSEAGRRCPHAEFVRPRFSAYQEVSKQVHAVFREFSALVEPLSLDEAYIDVTESTLLNGSAIRIAEEIRSIILQRTGLNASAGVSYNKFLAKIASDINKPNGLFTILPADGEAFVAALPIGKFYGVGKATETRMHELGITTGADLRTWTLAELSHEFGKSAQYYYNVARGLDHRPVRSSRTRKSIGSETTFGENLTSPDKMLAVLKRLTDRVVKEMQAKELCASTLTIKVRFANFDTFTRSHSHTTNFSDVSIPNRIMPFLLQRALETRQHASVRLLGVSLSGLVPQGDQTQWQLELPLP
ncbi:UNVERIFIED_CONTAM: hypothetical protein GTU68_051813 [Idotea baltica]|nr:hypothetical protein [Idotea baltica]